MDQKIMLEWMKVGQLPVSQALLIHYTDLSLDEKELLLLLQIDSFHAHGNSFPMIEELSERMTLSLSETAKVLESLLQRGFVTIERSGEQVISESYSLESLWKKLWHYYESKNLAAKAERVVTEETNLYCLFETEFGRPLSPFEAETMAAWLDQDHLPVELVKEALKEAVISGKLTFRYIDRILLDWKKLNIKTVEEARNRAEGFHGKTKQNFSETDRVKQSEHRVPFYDWLEKRKG
ncbi:DnaD domain-containing protein [Listeria sp. PSOL-1]|uniref:DnaD domain-containing protein n=1 Tax=Listeria sp. PSOL-1 TaxID=1844999 RepID=UPI0013D64513|nr:DnaD domain-containing protein [Listeria sp. PSOL-1]